MSAEGKLGPKKIRRAEALAGEPLVMAFAWSPGCWEVITSDDRHMLVNPREAAPCPEPVADPVHWTTCPSRVR